MRYGSWLDWRHEPRNGHRRFSPGANPRRGAAAMLSRISISGRPLPGGDIATILAFGFS